MGCYYIESVCCSIQNIEGFLGFQMIPVVLTWHYSKGQTGPVKFKDMPRDTVKNGVLVRYFHFAEGGGFLEGIVSSLVSKCLYWSGESYPEWTL